MHLLETRYQRAFADAEYREGVVSRLDKLGLLSPRLTLAHCVYARPGELDQIARAGAVIATNPSSNLHLASGVAPIGEALKRGCRVAIGVDASALDEDDDILREMRLGHFLHGGWGFESLVERGPWLAGIVEHGRFANGSPGKGALEVGEPADVLVLDLDRLDRDAIMPVEPIDLLFSRACAAACRCALCRGPTGCRGGQTDRGRSRRDGGAVARTISRPHGRARALSGRLERPGARRDRLLPQRPRLLLTATTDAELASEGPRV